MRFAAAAAALAVLAIAASDAGGRRFTPQDRTTTLISRSAAGGFPDGASQHPTIAGDYQHASFVAFDSDASDLVPGDSNAATDVFLVARARPYSSRGEPWRPGPTSLVSRGLGGRPANGRSYLPDLSGDRFHRPSCVAFVSDASNLVAGDTNGVADAFMADLRSGRITRVSVSSAGRQANGPTSDVKVDGSCSRVAFVSSADNLALRRTGRRAWRGLASARPPHRSRQVYVRVLRGTGAGVTFLASASASGRAANRPSQEVSVDRLSGAVAYASSATDLAGGDHGSHSDVYLTTIVGSSGTLRRRTTLVSATRRGRAGDAPSDQPALSAGGRYVAFRTAADDLLAGDTNKVADIARATVGRPGAIVAVSRSQALDQIANGPSARPAIVGPGTNVFFESQANNLQSTDRGSGNFDRNAAGDIFFWSALSRNVSLQSRDSSNEILNNAAGREPSGDHVAQGPALDPAVSYYGNYLLFDSPYPLIDLPIASQRFPGLTAHDAALMSNQDPALRQVYLRYIGPR